MIGFQQETISTINDTKKAINKINAASVMLSVFTPYAGTELFELCKKEGLINNNFNASLHHHQSQANYFCKNIKPEVFRNLIFEIERVIDKKNRINRFRKIFSRRIIGRMLELGMGKSLKRGLKLVIGR